MKRLGSLIVTMGLLLTACGRGDGGQGQAGQSGRNYKDTIKIGLDVDPNSLDPRLGTNVSTSRFSELVFSGLVELNEKLEPQPDLAEKWEQKSPTSWVFHLRKDVKWHDGSAFTADDVKYTFESLLDPATKSPARSRFTPVAAVKATDANTVEFTLKEPYAPLLTYMDQKIIPAAAKDNKGFADNPIGTGPYRFGSWVKQSVIRLEANPSYFRGAPATPKVEIYTIPDNTTRASSLESGDVDFIHSPLSPQDVSRLKSNSKFNVTQTDGLGMTWANFNQQAPLLKDKQVRKALSMFFDKKSISDNIYKGIDKPANGPVLPASSAFSDKVTDYPYDPDGALRILNDAGWKDTNGDGILDKDGQKLSITLSTHTEDPNRIQIAELVQNAMKVKGVDAKVTTVEWPSFSSALENGKFEIAVVGFLNITDPDRGMYLQLHSTGAQNYGKFNNGEVDKLLAQGRALSDPKERAPIYRKIAPRTAPW